MIIKLTEFDTGSPIYVNPHRISCIYTRQSTIVSTDREVFVVKEKPEDILNLISMADKNLATETSNNMSRP